MQQPRPDIQKQFHAEFMQRAADGGFNLENLRKAIRPDYLNYVPDPKPTPESVAYLIAINMIYDLGGLPDTKDGDTETWIWPLKGESVKFRIADNNEFLDEQSGGDIYRDIGRGGKPDASLENYAQYLANKLTALDKQKEALRTQELQRACDEAAKANPGLKISRQGYKFRLTQDSTPKLYCDFQINPKASEDVPFGSLLEEKIGVFEKERSGYCAKLAELEATFGVRKTTANSAMTLLGPHPDETLTIPLNQPFLPSFGMRQLEQFGQKLVDQEKRRQGKLDALSAKGFCYEKRGTKSDKPELVISHSDPYWGSKVAPLIPPAAMMGTDAVSLINEAAEFKPPEPERPATTVRTQAKPVLEIKDEDKIDIVLDMGLLKYLALNRTDGRSWLDIISAVSRLPTVNRVIIPSYIADWEFRGKIPAISGDGKRHLLTIDRAHPGANLKCGMNIFEDATRHAVGKDGKSLKRHIEDDNSKIVIWESPEQHELYGNLLRTTQRAGSPGAEREAINVFRRKNENMGEAIAMGYCKSKECTHPVVFVTNDGYFHRDFRDKSAGNSLIGSTGNHRGITMMPAHAFLNDLHEAFERHFPGNLAAFLNANYGGHETDTRARTIISNFNSYASERNGYNIVNDEFSFIGVRKDGQKEMTLREVLGAGVERIAREQQGKFAAMVAAGKTEGADRVNSSSSAIQH